MQRIRRRAVCHRVILANDQIRDLRRADIRNKRHVPALAAVVDAGGDRTGSGGLAGDTDLHRAIRLRGDRRSSRCAVACQHANRLPGKCIPERIGDPRPQRVRRRAICH